jgi:hypothetical protein
LSLPQSKCVVAEVIFGSIVAYVLKGLFILPVILIPEFY